MTPAVGYTEMKDSGFSWIGNMPANWSINLLSQQVRQIKNKNSNLQEQNLLSLSYGKIKRKDIEKTDGLLPASFDGYNIIEAGDIVLRLTDLQNDHKSLRVGLATEKGIITSAYTTLRPRDPAMSKYLYYLLHTFDIKKGFYGMGSGVRQGLNYDEVKTLKIPIPSGVEQTAIVAYLDTECAKIDEIIAEAKASIEDYKQWKASIIYEAVTKGFDPDAEMKDSGIEWIGEIPKSWVTSPLKTLVSCNELTLSEKTDDDFEFEYIDIGSVQYGYGVTQTQHLMFKDAPSRARRIVNENDVILSTVRTCLKAVAMIGKITSPTIVSTGFAVLHPKNICAAFLYYAVLSDNFVSTVEANSVGISYPAINASDILSMKIPHPICIEEQKSIANRLDVKCSHIDKLIVEKQSLISDLEAYKKSLIYEVVTGKRRVC